MLDWIKNINKEYPNFWKNYLEKFELKSTRYVVLSIETSGLNPEKDIILSMGATAILNDKIIISDSFEVTILQYLYNNEKGIFNEFILENKQIKLTESESLESFINYLGNSIIVGHRIDFDIEILNQALKKLNCGKLKNEALDIEIMYRKWKDFADDKNFSIEDLAIFFKILKSDRNSAAEDAFTLSLVFLKLKSRLGIR